MLGVGAVPHGLLETDVPGRAEQDPAVWVDAMFSSCATALDAATKRAGADVRPSVKALAVSGQQHGMVALDASFAPIRPAKLWCDTESAPEAAELATQLGWGIVASFTSTKLLWLKRNEPENFGKLAHVALPHDYLNLQLTGSLVMECGDASGTGLLDTATRQWDDGAMVDGGLRRSCRRSSRRRRRRARSAPKRPRGSGCRRAAGRAGWRRQHDERARLRLLDELRRHLARHERHDSHGGGGGVSTGAVCLFSTRRAKLPLLCTLNCAAVRGGARAYGLERDKIAAAEAEPMAARASRSTYLAASTPNWPQSGALVGLRHLARPGLVYRAAARAPPSSATASRRCRQGSATAT